ncbi:MAG TPA: PP2C family protein-serine/threonine phosphatase [Rhodothermales bacterium]|nr:PP2C family protein-serine/threonine phosphatase [Rhodothermales bacterium]
MSERSLTVHQTEHLDLRALYEATQLLSSSVDLNFVLNNLLLIAMSKLLVTRGVVLLFDPVEQAHKVAASKGVASLKPGDVVAFEPLGQAVPLSGDDIPETLKEHRISHLLPVEYHERCIGWLGLGQKPAGKPLEDDELAFTEALVSISSSAVQNSLIIEELQQSNKDLDGKIQELNTLFDLSQEFNSTRDRERLVRLLSFALMGQLLVKSHLFLLRKPSGTDAEGRPRLEEPLTVVAKQGLKDLTRLDELMKRLNGITEAVAPGLVDSGDEDEWEILADFGLEIAIPLRLRGATQGILCLGRKMTGQRYLPGDVEFLYALGNLALTSIQNTYLVDEQIERERMAQEMRLAREIQERLLPSKLPECEHIEIAAFATPSREVSGDYFDVVSLDGERLMMAIADVTGKGMPASLLMANMQACLRIVLPMDLKLEEATARINDVIHGNTGFDKFITFFWCICSADGKSLSYVNAGHNPPVHINADGTMTHLEAGGLLLGIMGGMPYERGEVGLKSGDVIAMFTDGVTEAMNPQHEEYDDPRLEKLLLDNRHLSAQEILDVVLADVAEFTQGAPQSDDITMMVMKVT